MFNKNLKLVFAAMFLFSVSTGLFCEENIVPQDHNPQDQNLNLLNQDVNTLDENLTYTIEEFEETDVFENNLSENETEINDDDDEIDFDDLDLDVLDDPEISFYDQVRIALAYFKYAATENIKENSTWYATGVLIAGFAAATFAYCKFIKKN